MRRRRLFLASALAALSLATVVVLLLSNGGSPRHRTTPTAPIEPPSPGPPAQPAPAAEQFGVNVNRLFDDQFGAHGFTSGQVSAQLRALRATGATVARTDTLWEVTEPQPPLRGVHSYDWTFDDSIAGSLAANGLRWLPVIDYTAGWARSTPGELHSPPRAGADFAAFAAALAARYGPGGSFWRQRPALAAQPVGAYEVWNEPDNGEFWNPAPDAAQYADLYLRARDAISAVDPTARVIVGGLTNPEAFLPAMLRARPDLLGHVDGVAIHPYGPTPRVALSRVRSARSTLASLGLASVPLYVTEFGWTIHPAGALNWAPEQRRPGYIASTIATLGHTDCTIAATVLYTWVTPERDPGNKEDWYGIHPPDGGGSPDTDAFIAGVGEAIRPGPTDHLCRPG